MLLSCFQIEPPTEVITKLKVPSTDSVSFHSVESYSNYSSSESGQPDFAEAKKFPVTGFPSAFNVCHVQSLFTQVDVVSFSFDILLIIRIY